MWFFSPKFWHYLLVSYHKCWRYSFFFFYLPALILLLLLLHTHTHHEKVKNCLMYLTLGKQCMCTCTLVYVCLCLKYTTWNFHFYSNLKWIFISFPFTYLLCSIPIFVILMSSFLSNLYFNHFLHSYSMTLQKEYAKIN